MEYIDDDEFLVHEEIEYKRVIQEMKYADRGYNLIYRKFYKNNRLRRNPIDIYTSSGKGSYIRNAFTGAVESSRVSSKNEDLYFKVSLATGECVSKNGFSTLFYNSPNDYMEHTNSVLDERIISKWEEKRNIRLSQLA
jgi:hypothetical protein